MPKDEFNDEMDRIQNQIHTFLDNDSEDHTSSKNASRSSGDNNLQPKTISHAIRSAESNLEELETMLVDTKEKHRRTTETLNLIFSSSLGDRQNASAENLEALNLLEIQASKMEKNFIDAVENLEQTISEVEEMLSKLKAKKLSADIIQIRESINIAMPNIYSDTPNLYSGSNFKSPSPAKSFAFGTFSILGSIIGGIINVIESFLFIDFVRELFGGHKHHD
jgi:hypothetical protein